MVEVPATVAINNIELDAAVDASTPEITTDDYSALANKPSINGVVLVGDKSTNDLHIDHVPLADNLVATTGTTDTTPYVYRASQGPIAELRKVVGGTLAWNQLVANGDFSAGTTNWAGQGTSISASNGILTVVPSANGGTRGVNHNFVEEIPAGHKCIIEFYETPNKAVGAYARFISNGATSYFDTAVQDISSGSRGRYSQMFNTDNSVAQLRILPVLPGNPATTDTYKIEDVAVYDLTQMFGSTIADAIYTMETTTAGSGIAFFHSLLPSDYYPYSAPTLASVQTSARQALDGNGNVIRSYPLDSDLTLRGIPKLTNGALSYDGDIYLPGGSVTRRHAEIDLGSLTWSYNSTNAYFYASMPTDSATAVAGGVNGVCDKYLCTTITSADFYASDKVLTYCNANMSGSKRVFVRDTAYTNAATFKTAVTGSKLVYILATPTTESADPYTETQLGGVTEQFVCDNYIPVGNESFYPTDLTNVVQNLAPLPTTAGTYKLQVTVSGGVPSYSWVSG